MMDIGKTTNLVGTVREVHANNVETGYLAKCQKSSHSDGFVTRYLGNEIFRNEIFS